MDELKNNPSYQAGYDYTRDWLHNNDISYNQAANDLQTMMVDLVGYKDADIAYEGAIAALKEIRTEKQNITSNDVGNLADVLEGFDD